VYLVPLIHKVEIDLAQWQRQAPRAIPFATLCGICGFICAAACIWPIYHILALPILFTLYMGFLVLITLF
jgi:hypothetical protein